MRDPYMLGIKENIIDIPYDVITSVKLEKGLFSSTIRFEAPALVGSKRLGMINGIVSGERDNEGVIQAIPKRKAEDLLQVIRSGMHHPGYNSSEFQSRQSSNNSSSSVADELTKLAKLKEQGVITEEEFAKLKKGMLDGKKRIN
jgi:Short C-terminal domain/Bacterial PH domain